MSSLAWFGCTSNAGAGDTEPAGETSGTTGESATTAAASDTDPQGETTGGESTAAGTEGETDGDPTTQWEEHACSMAIPNGLSAADFTCGTLSVPKSWDAPGDQTVTMEVAVLRSLAEEAAPDPFVFFGGGPGVYNLEGYLQSQAVSTLAPIRETRDVVFFDKRGNGLSSPALQCPEYAEELLGSFVTDAGVVGDAEAFVRGYERCRERLASEGIDPADFDSYQVANDVAALMDALEYETANLYGISYGGREAQVMLREFPQRVRSIILDSTTMPEFSFAAAWPANFERALDVMAEQCAAAESCGASYPDLKATLVEAIQLLDETPHVSTVEGPDGPLDLVVTGGRFAQGIQGAMYRADLLALLPSAIGSAAAGQTALIDAFAPALVDTGGIDRGLYASTLCAEELPFDTQASIDDARAGLTATVTDPIYEVNGGYMLAMCEAWGVPARPAVEAEPVLSDVPALVVGGNFDPVSPPSYGEALVTNLSNGQFVLFNGIGHGVLRSDTAPGGELSCAQQLITAFLDDPGSAVDDSCAGARPSPY